MGIIFMWGIGMWVIIMSTVAKWNVDVGMIIMWIIIMSTIPKWNVCVGIINM